MTAPLEAIRDELVFIRGLDMYAGGATHEGGIAKILTGNGDVSLDLFLGDVIGGDTPHKLIQLGVATNFQNGSGSWSYIGAGPAGVAAGQPAGGADLGGSLALDFITYRRFFCEQLVDLVQQMKAMPDGDSNLLANTVVMMGTEINDGNLHDHSDMPFVLAGQAGGALETGRSLDYRGTAGGMNGAHTKLLVSIADLVGVGVDTFGYAEQGPGGLDGLSPSTHIFRVLHSSEA